MSRVLRGAWSRRGVLATLVAMTAVVVCGAVTVLGFARAADTSVLLAAPLLLLGAVAVPAIGRELAAARRTEVGLVRLHGVRGRRLAVLLLAEPVLAVVLGALLGVGAGVVSTSVATAVLLEQRVPIDAEGLARAGVAGAAVAAAALVAVVFGGAATVREGLAGQLSTAVRPRRASTAMLFAHLLVIVGAGVALYRGQLAEGRPDLLVLLGPALVGLALAQVAIWTVRGLARVGLGATAGGGLATFLAGRRVARADDLSGPVRLVVAAGVLAAVAATAATSIDEWSSDQARVELAGARVVPLPEMGGVQALALTRRLDPEGQHLMGSVLLPGRDDLSERRGYVDASRWDTVAAPALAGSAAAPGGDVADLGTGVPEWAVTAERMTVAARGLPDTPAGPYSVSVSYVTDTDARSTVDVELDLAPGREDRASVRLDDCRVGCQVVGMEVRPGSLDDISEVVLDVRALRLTTLRLGELDVLAGPWVPGETVPGTLISRFEPQEPDRVPRGTELVSRVEGGLDLVLVPAALTEVVLEAPAEVPVLATTPSDAATEGFGTLGADDRGATVADTSSALPLVGEVGTLSDLSTGVWASGPSISDSQTAVVVAPSAPAALVQELVDVAGADPVDLADQQSRVSAAAGGVQGGGYALMALACLAVAVLALAVGASRHLRGYRRDVAALRSLGVPVATARAAGRLELAVVAGVVAGAVVVGGWVAVRWLLPGLPLLSTPAGSLPFSPDPALVPLLAPALLAAAVVVLLGGRARRARAAQTRPSLLREEES